jgi:hypothetical protein
MNLEKEVPHLIEALEADGALVRSSQQLELGLDLRQEPVQLLRVRLHHTNRQQTSAAHETWA